MSLIPGGPTASHLPLPVAGGPLVGREAELARLVGLLEDSRVRVVTLTGPPGVGKTSLALAVARAVAAGFADGVAFVDLTAVRDPDVVPAEIAAALGPGDTAGIDGMARALADQDLLLLLDNFEHVLPAAAALPGLLAACPGLRVLVTSRERLHLRAEHEVPVLPLALPGPAELADLTRLAATPAVEMLVGRVRTFQPDFAVTAANHSALVEICVRLDGLPLALELAAPRFRLFNPGEVTFRLRNRLGSLASDAHDAPERHRTLHAALTWSHALLGPEERALFHRLSVFVGGWTLAAAAEVCELADPVELMASLVDKNLIRRLQGTGAVARFGMLESLREFAAELLDADGGTAAAVERHAAWFARLAALIDARIGTLEEPTALEEVGADVGNLRAALATSLAAEDTGRALTLAAALGWHSWTRGQLGSGEMILNTVMAAAAAVPDPPEDPLAGVLFMAGAVAQGLGELDRAEERLADSLEITERIGARRRTAITTAFLGHLARLRGRHADAVVHHERAGALHRQLGNDPGAAWSRYDLGLLAHQRGEDAQAAEHLLAALAVFRDLDYGWGIACSAWALARVQLRRGRAPDAAVLLTEALERFDAGDDGRGLAQSLEAVAALAGARRDFPAAARLLGSAAALRIRLAAPLPQEEAEQNAVLSDRIRTTLGASVVEAAHRAGAAMPVTSALDLAHEVLARAIPEPRAIPRQADVLTQREHDVARLVRYGRTNRQIGRELGITERTAEVHVHHIIRKLGASSRAEIAAWVAAGGSASGA